MQRSVIHPQKRLQLAEQRLGVLSGEKITLQDTIALSLHGLPDAAQNAFYALGAFAPKPERFSPEAVEAVTQADSATLAVLAARNLLEIQDEQLQLTLHQTIADAARTRLEEAAIARHRDYYLTLVQQGRNRYDWWLIFDVYGQIRRAWQNTPEDASLLDWLSALRPYLTVRGLWQEYLEGGKRALAMVVRQGMRKKEGPLRANIGLAHYYLSQWDQAIDHFQRARPILEEAGDRVGFAKVLHNIGMVYHAMGDKAKTLDHFQQALTMLEETDDQVALADVLGNIGIVHTELDNEVLAAVFHEQARSIRDENKHRIPDASQDEVHLADFLRVEREVRQRPTCLVALHSAFVMPDEAEVDFEGHIVVGAQREEDKTYYYWHAVFADGKRVQAGYIDDLPGKADAVLLMGEREADATFATGSLPENHQLLMIDGNRQLISKFVERYLRDAPAEEPKDPQKVAKKLHGLGRIFAATGQRSLAMQNYASGL